MATDPRDARRTTEDLPFKPAGPGPARYAATTGRPVRYLAVGDGTGTILGYLWVADGEEAAGFVRRPAAGDDGGNEAVAWSAELRDAKSRGVPAAGLLAEFARAELPIAQNARHLGAVIPGSEARADDLDDLKHLAAR
ncbi:hypothetical protein [Actinomadura sp. 9N407]|uniref:hypothetical protein n=1 Tax=Actinomadura sp. 9N407 TaxID=3375154 RepID=UPI0037BA3067